MFIDYDEIIEDFETSIEELSDISLKNIDYENKRDINKMLVGFALAYGIDSESIKDFLVYYWGK